MIEMTPRIPRHWGLYGFPETGKTDFSIQMLSPIMVIDSDHRYAGVLAQNPGAKVYTLTDNPADLHDARIIATLLDKYMPGSDVKTIVCDSITSIIEPIVTATMMANRAKENKNRATAWAEKAFQMRTLQDAVNKWGVDTLWIYHELRSTDSNANDSVRQTLSEMERSRLARSLNVHLKTIVKNNSYGIQVVHSRRGNAGFTIWDEAGHWKGMPELIEEAIYVTVPEPDSPPERFSTPTQAAEWAVTTGAFKEIDQALAEYETRKIIDKPESAREMRNVWVAYVNTKLALADQ